MGAEGGGDALPERDLDADGSEFAGGGAVAARHHFARSLDVDRKVASSPSNPRITLRYLTIALRSDTFAEWLGRKARPGKGPRWCCTHLPERGALPCATPGPEPTERRFSALAEDRSTPVADPYRGREPAVGVFADNEQRDPLISDAAATSSVTTEAPAWRSAFPGGRFQSVTSMPDLYSIVGQWISGPCVAHDTSKTVKPK